MYHLKKYKNGTEKGTMVYIAPHVGYNPKTKKVEYNNWEELIRMPLTFNILTSGTLIWSRTDETTNAFSRSIAYSKNNGDFVTITASLGNSVTIDVNAGDTLVFIYKEYNANNNIRGYSEGQDSPPPCSCGFKDGTATFNVKGSIMSILNPDNYLLDITTVYMKHFFQNAGVIDASELVFSPNTYRVPDLDYFFKDCTLLTGPPQLPYTNSSPYFKGMFNGCTSLKEAPALPSMNLKNSSSHYLEMFKDCTSLEKAPLLPAPALRNYNYQDMFNGCTNLKRVEAYFFEGTAGFITDWLKNVSSSGQLIVNKYITDSYTNTLIRQELPSGWTKKLSFYKQPHIPMYHRYLNTSHYIDPGDTIYCKFIGKEDNIIIGADNGAGNGDFKIWIENDGTLKMRFATTDGHSEHTLTTHLNDGENEFTVNFNKKSFVVNNVYITTFQNVPVTGTNVLYIHATNSNGTVYMTDNDFDLRELKITSSDNVEKYHVVPISYYGRHTFLNACDATINTVNLVKYNPSST